MLLLWLVPPLWAVDYIVARKAPEVIGPYALALSRWCPPALILVFITKRKLRRLGLQGRALDRGDEHYADLLGLTGVDSSGAMWWLGESFGARQNLGVALALAGVVHGVVKGNWTALDDVQFVARDAWILAATLSCAAYASLQKSWPSPQGATARLAAICAGGSLVLLPLTL